MYTKNCIYTLIMLYSFKSAFSIIISGPLTDAYSDNGKQISIQHLMAVKKLNQIKQVLSIMFGISQLHKYSLPINLNGSAEQFILNIYQSSHNDGLLARKPISIFGVGQYNKRVVQRSDDIFTIYPSNQVSISDVYHGYGKHVMFDLNSIPLKETHIINLAEVHLYQSSRLRIAKMYSVTLYQVLITQSGKKKLKLVDSQNTTSNFNGWLRFNITCALISWSYNSYPNKGLYVSVHKLNNKDHEIWPEVIGMVNWVGKHQLFKNKKPFLAVYSKSINGHYAIDHNILQEKQIQKSSEITDDDNKIGRNSDLFLDDPVPNSPQLQHCQRQPLYVNFFEIGLSDYFIFPNGYNAFYCRGVCQFPYYVNVNATNHAHFQAMVQIYSKTKEVPRACCVPKEYGPLTIVSYSKKYNSIKYNKYEEMIVLSCGCH